MALSGLAIAGIIIIVIGLIMTIVGIVLLIIESTSTIAWYVWLLVIGGIILAIIGGIMLAVALSENTCVKPCATPIVNQCQVPYVAPVVQRQVAPQPMYSERYEQVGAEYFDPDPQTTVTETPSTAVRTNVVGPYGPGGTPANVSGVYKSPGQRRIITRDIPEHQVTSNNSAYVNPGYTTYPTVNTGLSNF